jgi:ribosome-interacting GTPase 1
MDRLLTTYKEKYEEKKEAWGLAKLGLDDAAKETETLMEKLDEDGVRVLNKLTDVVYKSTDAFGSLIEQVDKLMNINPDELDTLINKFENMAQSITTVIEESGKYEEIIGRVKFDGLIDDWNDLDKIYKSLIEHG